MGCNTSRHIDANAQPISANDNTDTEVVEQQENEGNATVDPVERIDNNNNNNNNNNKNSDDKERPSDSKDKAGQLEDVEESEKGWSQTRKIVIAGPPAGGKGTQCAVISDKFGVIHLSTGDMLREQIGAKTELGLQAEQYVNQGQLVPDDLIVSIVMDRIAQQDVQQCGWLLDGFPRTPAQAKIMRERGIVPDTVIVLEIEDDKVVQRISGRRIDPETGNTYHVEFNPCTDPEVAKRLKQRDDDTEEKIRVRLQTYRENLQPILDEFPDAIRRVNADQDIEAVSASVIAALTLEQ